MKTKEIEIDGEKYLIAPLNVGQVRKHVISDAKEANAEESWIRGYDVICCGLNNARPIKGNGAQDRHRVEDHAPLWTHERIDNELPWAAYHRLQTEILELSGFSKVEGRPTGEAPAPASPVIQ